MTMTKQVPLSILVDSTVFAYEGIIYQKGTTKRGSHDEKYDGVRAKKEETLMLTCCYPKLGNQFQPNIKILINDNTEVFVNNIFK